MESSTPPFLLLLKSFHSITQVCFSIQRHIKQRREGGDSLMPKAMSQNLHGIRIFKPLYIPDANFPSFPFVFDEGEDFMTQQEDQ